MKRENRVVLSIHGVASQITQNFLVEMFKQHKIDPSGTYPYNNDSPFPEAYFDQLAGGKVRPRCLLVTDDGYQKLNSPNLKILKNQGYESIIQSNRNHLSTNCYGNGFPYGIYIDESKLQIEDSLRVLIEGCDFRPSLDIVHEMKGAGAGITANLLQKLEEFDLKSTRCYSVFSSDIIDDTQINPYDQCLSMNYLYQNALTSYVLDSDSIRYINPLNSTALGRLYRRFGETIANTTLCSRFSYSGSASYSVESLIPHLSCKFLVCASAHQRYSINAVHKLVQSLYGQESQLLLQDSRFGTILAAHTYLQGAVDYQTHSPTVAYVQDMYAYMKDEDTDLANFYLPSCKEGGVSGTMVLNTTRITIKFREVLRKFRQLFRRKAYLHNYAGGNGMDQMELSEAEQSLSTVIEQYQSLEIDYEEDQQPQIQEQPTETQCYKNQI